VVELVDQDFKQHLQILKVEVQVYNFQYQVHHSFMLVVVLEQ
jgi:hypothetical protein